MPKSSSNLSQKQSLCTIDYVDNLGQGVDKKQDKITLIPKTLPGEKVLIESTGEQSKIRWGKVVETLESSKDRIVPECLHYQKCFGCHYLHTNYQTEIELKITQSKLLFKKLLTDSHFTFLQAKERFGYRNRIQLHYSKKKKLLGFIGENHQIHQVQECQIINPELKLKLKELYSENQWPNLVSDQHDEGHIELYFKDNKVEVSVNRPYADGGFSQVNQAMNEVLIDQVTQLYEKYHQPGNLLDLFGGSGNLTQKIKTQNLILSIDNYSQTPSAIGPKSFLNLNLFERKSLSKLKGFTREGFTTFIVDPPRSGFKELKLWSDEFCPSTIVYVSCHPQTQIRDLSEIMSHYFVKEVLVLDLFPGTFHFESIVVLTRR